MSQFEEFFFTLCEVSRAFGTTMQSQEILQMIVDKAIESTDVEAACLFMADQEKDVFSVKASRGLSENYLKRGVSPVSKIMPEIEKDGFFYSADVRNDKRLAGKDAKKNEGITTILAVPVVLNGQAVGALGLYSKKRREFAQPEIDFLTALAEQGAMALDRSNLLDQIRNNTKLFWDLAQDINASLDIKTILNTLSANVARALDVKAASIRLLDEENKELRLVASHGLSEKYLNKGPISAEKSIAEALKGKPVVVKDASHDRGVQYRKEKEEEGIVSILCVPIKTKKGVIGVLRLYSGKSRDFKEDEIMLVSALAQQGGLAIKNASMYLTLQQTMKDLEQDMLSQRSWF